MLVALFHAAAARRIAGCATCAQFTCEVLGSGNRLATHTVWANCMQVAAVWIWLSQRFGAEAFPGAEDVRATAQHMVQLMSDGLQV